jgi:PEP-CTERM motif
MKYSKVFLGAAFVMMLSIMVPAASADGQKLVLGSQVATVNAMSVKGSSVSVTLPASTFDLVLLRDELKHTTIPTLSLEFFKAGSSTPYETETFTGVTISDASIFMSKMGLEFSGNFKFKSSAIAYSTSVPEPSSLGLLAAGLVGLIAVSGRKFLFAQQSAR